MRALIVTAAGINCEQELAEAFALAGATPELVHLNRLLRRPAIVDEADLIGLPGGFSFGDAVAAGRIMAHLMRRTLYPALVHAIERGVPMIAPCNGFQIAAQIGLLPGPLPEADGATRAAWPEAPPRPSISLAHNASDRFVDRWVRVEIPEHTRCVWTAGLDAAADEHLLPVAHGEGRFVPESDERLKQLEADGQIAVRYARTDNPNGSAGDVAGICDPSGLVFGLLPHPERWTRWTQHPTWTRLDPARRTEAPLGLRMFRSAVKRARTPVSCGG